MDMKTKPLFFFSKYILFFFLSFFLFIFQSDGFFSIRLI